MSIKAKIANLMAGVFTLNSGAVAEVGKAHENFEYDENLNSIKVGSLNETLPKFLAQHRSHSSHGSHRSHRSSSGGSYSKPKAPSYPRTPSPTPKPQPAKSPSDSQLKQSDPNGKPKQPDNTYNNQPVSDATTLQYMLSEKEKREMLIKRVQLYLKINGYYNGDVDGIMGPATRYAINKFQEANGVQISDKLNVKTLDAMGIIVR